MIKVSIIMPVYNVQDYIAEALNSCINQTLQEIEIIVVDDCGQDRSIEIAKEFATKDNRIKIIHNEKNQGLFATRINGVMQCSGNYILFLDSDDFLDLQACEATYNLAKQHDSCIVCFNFIRFCKENKEHSKTFNNNHFLRDEYCLHICNTSTVYDGHWNIASKLIKKETFLESLRYLETDKRLLMSEDALFYCFIVLCAKSITTSSLSLYHYRINENSTTENISLSHLMSCLKDEEYVLTCLKNFLKTQENSFAVTAFFKIMILDLHYCHLNTKKKYFKSKNFVGKTVKQLLPRLQRKVIKLARKRNVKALKHQMIKKH